VRRLILLMAALGLMLPGTAHAGVPTAAVGHITLRSDGVFLSYLTSGVYATSAFDCKLTTSTVGTSTVKHPVVVCTDQQTDPLIDWECTHFLLTATVPAPGTTGIGTVSGRVDCESATDLDTPPVVGTGVATADNYAPPPVTLGLATIVKCWALGTTEETPQSGSWEVDCWEPGVANPLG